MEKSPPPLGGIGSMLSLSWESSMTNLASGDGEGDVEIAVHFLLGFLNRHLVGPLLELHILHADRGALRLHLLRLAAESSFLAF